MDGFMHQFGYPFGFFYGFNIFWWIIFLAIGYLVYQDANKRGMNGPLWFILVILPMVGLIFLLIYIVIRETSGKSERDEPMYILKERYARGEISEEEFKRMKEELEK
ncbi:hypothetical protein Asulf_00490 [Archaeoglobus sulfaticallidus PM70-1]|uniref:SHOCT domain-containing protein n=1 Tax=Archaeoglobus sulfaticallidus PM70-1 TaxID=387631 RepID=N0BC14_9EURY|nr:SHOCT domain-containing protein [Archaeoglobus sulfaticallidus]AGK60513.1 hypothetical protein Asulf_00490 [Archaeoglobus sulfaticallidus PM70-1]